VGNGSNNRAVRVNPEDFPEDFPEEDHPEDSPEDFRQRRSVGPHPAQQPPPEAHQECVFQQPWADLNLGRISGPRGLDRGACRAEHRSPHLHSSVVARRP